MNKLHFFIIILFLSTSTLFAQTPSFNANTTVPAYNTPFRLGVNPDYRDAANGGFSNPNLSENDLADLAAGTSTIDGAGIKAMRVPLPEDYLLQWGYGINLPNFQHYDNVGLLDNTVFLNGATATHQDPVVYCTGNPTVSFADMYLPIWDSNNGTPINEDNHYAWYVYQTVDMYKDHVKFWEIWNEPDFDLTGNGWKPSGMAGNWWDSAPGPCDIEFHAPVYHYIRMLRISYEVIKSIDPSAFVTTGGIGYESFLDVILRYTDNPVDGSVTADYPLGGGAYFDVLSYHNYPHVASLKTFNTTTFMWDDDRHTDKAIYELILQKDKFETVLNNYQYDGSTYPKKHFIITETNVPNVAIANSNFFGSYEAQRNYAIKAIVAAYENDIKQLALYKLGNTWPEATAWDWNQVSGLYQPMNHTPYPTVSTVIPNEQAIATHTSMDLLFGSTYDAAKTAALNLTADIAGGVFDTGAGYIYVLWAKTDTDLSEVASATYSFPSGVLNGTTTDLDKKEWDFANTGTVTTISPNNIALTGAPIFLEEVLSPLPVQLTDFKALLKNEKVLLEWTTMSEIDSRGFELQFSSDAVSWETLGFREGAGNSTERIDYEFLHETPVVGMNYYRLKQLDTDNSFSYTSIIGVEFKRENPTIQLFPNPVKGMLNITNFEGDGFIYNMTGQLVLEFSSQNLDNGKIAVHHLPKGSYHLLLVDNEGERFNRKLIKN